MNWKIFMVSLVGTFGIVQIIGAIVGDDDTLTMVTVRTYLGIVLIALALALLPWSLR